MQARTLDRITDSELDPVQAPVPDPISARARSLDLIARRTATAACAWTVAAVLSSCTGTENVAEESAEVKNGDPASGTFSHTVRVNSGCTGSLVSQDWVVTARHCLSGNKDPNNYTIRLDGVTRSVDHVLVHPYHLFGVDVAMMHLEYPYTEWPQDVDLWPLDTSFLYGQTVDCYGYGAIDFAGSCTSNAQCPAGFTCNTSKQWCLKSSGGQLYHADLTVIPDPEDPDMWYQLEVPDEEGQVLLPGDSGGGCWIGDILVGVMKGGGATENRQTSAEAWATWVGQRRQCSPFNPNQTSTGHCTPECPCSTGEGDCDSNSGCYPGLECLHDVGAEYGLPASFDVCGPPRGFPSYCPVFDPDDEQTDFCSDGPSLCACNVGEGDCDTDNDCGGSLVCVEGTGPAVGLPSGWAVCDYPAAPGCRTYDPDVDDTGFCTNACPCGLGQGDCDSDAQCRGGLVCKADVGAAFGKPADYDMCMKP